MMLSTGLDPEILAIADGEITPAEFFAPPPTRGEDGVLNPISFDNAAMEMRPLHSPSLHTLVHRVMALRRRGEAMMRLARMRGLIHSTTHLSYAPASTLRAADMSLESVQTFGCSPSNAILDDYSSTRTTPHCNASESPIRSAGFHIHQEIADPSTHQMAVALLDGYLGLQDVIVNGWSGWQRQSQMRRLSLGYGRAGEYRLRPSPSGTFILEYRVMSPWPLSRHNWTGWAISTMKAICLLPPMRMLAILDRFPHREKITHAINHGDFHTATALIHLCRKAWRVKENEVCLPTLSMMR